MLRAICSLLSVFSVSPVIEFVIFTALVGIVFLIQIVL